MPGDLDGSFRYATGSHASAVVAGSAAVFTEPAASAASAHDIPPSAVPRPRLARDAGGRSRRGQHRREVPGARRKLLVLNTRFIAFGTIGAAVFVMGLG